MVCSGLWNRPRLRRVALLMGLVLIVACPLLAADINAADRTIEFNRDIRPLLSENCFACHGPDARKREAGLRLDRAEGASARLESGAVALVPGQPGESELVRRIESTDPEEVMPPADSNKHLTPDQIALLRQWVAAGGKYEGHWAFLPLRRQAPPTATPALPPIDAFVAAELPRHGLAASPVADPLTLARRVALDLTGLPPTAEQSKRLAADPSDAGYERLVDELLASPRYGERMAIWWLDLVRYADSVGYHGDQPVNVWPFREYVIRALNDNKPFDQFTIEQLAGDLLPGATTDNRVAAGYNRLGMMSAEGGVQPKEYLAKYIAERVRNVGGAWLGLTTGCAECHDHKYDPLTTRDFYRLESFFADIQEQGLYDGNNFGPMISLPTPEQAAEITRRDGEIVVLEEQYNLTTPEFEQAQAAWEASARQALQSWSVLPLASATHRSGKPLKQLDDGSLLAVEPREETDSYTLVGVIPPTGITALRLEVLPDPSLPSQGPGRADNGNFVLSEIRVSAAPPADAAATQSVGVKTAQADHSQQSFDAANTIDNKPETGWAIHPAIGQPHNVVLELKEPIAGGSTLTVVLDHNFGTGHAVGRLRLAVTTVDNPGQFLTGFPVAVSAVLAVDPAQRSADQRQTIAAHFRSIYPASKAVLEKLTALRKAREDLQKSFPTSVAVVTVPPRPIRVLPRGNWMDTTGEEVLPGLPSFLPGPAASEARLTRLDLARWIVAPDNPLTARVLVNRLWKLFLGSGLSRKLDDLGGQGELPTHPELLDWLAADMIDHGWNLKHAIKTIVMSQAYRRSSQGTPQMHEIDPQNRWLARQTPLRLDAELVRDQALWISGLLVERLGGPSVKPYQPARYWAYLNFPEREWQNSTGDDLYRRSLYTHWQRQYLHPSLLAFDAPSREECAAERPRSNTPLQALVLLNDPIYVESAHVFAELILHSGGSATPQRLNFAVERALGRGIRPAEAQVLADLLDRHREYFSQNPAAAKELVSTGARAPASDVDPAELAAWTSVARVILNLHSVVTRN